jgi:hypothetical protein
MLLFTGAWVVCIPNAIDLPPWSELGEHSISRSRKDLLILRRLAINQKGLDCLLREYACFLEQTGDQETQLIIAGTDFRGELESWCGLTGLVSW